MPQVNANQASRYQGFDRLAPVLPAKALADAVQPDYAAKAAETSHLLSSAHFLRPNGYRFADDGARGVIERCVRQHCDQDPEETISNTSEGAAVSVAALPKALVIRAAGWVVLQTDATPVIGSLS
jgi:hypothetical protein